jgi:hypothetical protein
MLGWRLVSAQQIPAWGSGEAPFALALIGDMPYGPSREPAFERVVEEINWDNDVDFVMHAGDIKAGSEQCSDALIMHRFEMYQRFQRAFVYTPGDNEWTDCHRANNGGHLPTERLTFLRSIFFPQLGETIGGQRRPVRSQALDGGAVSDYVENVMFTKHQVLFATVHVVGSNNGYAPWNSGMPPFDSTDTCATPRPDRINEVNNRLSAGLAWLDEIFVHAAGAKGVFLMIQANPDNPPAAGCPNGFTQFMDELRDHAADFGGPVLFAHGDDHYFFVDQPFVDPDDTTDPDNNPLFSRVQTYGEGLVHWVKVRVDPRSPGVFSVEPRIVRSNLP